MIRWCRRGLGAVVMCLLVGAAAACGAGEPNFHYGSGVSVLPGSSPSGGQWASDGRPPSVQFPAPSNETPSATISIPDLGLAAIPIFDRGLNSSRVMQIATGYSMTRYDRSSFFGGQSNTVLYGHDDIQGGVLGRLADLHKGAQIYVTLHDGSKLAYVVNRSPTIVAPTFVQLLAPTAVDELTIFTCYPLWVDDHRIFVTASPIGA